MADRRLQVFHTVARVLSFTKAAETLHMTQPAVTFQVKQLEDVFNTRLFDRTHNKITLTDAGRVVYEYADRILDLYEQMNDEVRCMTGDVNGNLQLGASTSIAEYLLPSLLAAFKKEYPEVSIQLQVGNTDAIVSMVENNVIDLGLVEAQVPNKNLEVEICRYDEMVVIVPNDHELANREILEMKDLKKHAFIRREEGSGSRAVIDQALKEAGMSPSDLNVVMELGSPESIKGAVEAGVGVAIVSRSTLMKELKLKSLVAISMEPKLTRPFSHVRQRQKFRHRAIGELMVFAEEYCRDKARKDGFEVPEKANAPR